MTNTDFAHTCPYCGNSYRMCMCEANEEDEMIDKDESWEEGDDELTED